MYVVRDGMENRQCVGNTGYSSVRSLGCHVSAMPLAPTPLLVADGRDTYPVPLN
jgi:hypothetical protein